MSEFLNYDVVLVILANSDDPQQMPPNHYFDKQRNVALYHGLNCLPKSQFCTISWS